MELIDKDAVVAEIERIEYETNYEPFTDEVLGKRNVCRKIREFLDTLEVKEVDLEKDSNPSYKEALKYIEDNTQIRYYESRNVEGFRRGLGMEKEYYVEQYVAKKAIRIAIGYKN